MSDEVVSRILNPASLLPESQAWAGVPSRLTLAGHPSVAGSKPYAVPGHTVEVVAVRSNEGPGVLVLLDDESAADEVVASIRRRMVVPTIVTVRGREPQPVREALEALADVPRARATIRGAGVPQAALDQRYFQPILDSEARRGNQGFLYFGDNRESGAAFLFAGPIDSTALLAEFEFDEGMELADPERPKIRYRSADGVSRWVLAGSGQVRNPAMTQMRDEWWREWRSKPRPALRLHNPFIHPDALPPLEQKPPVMLAAVPANIVLGEEMSNELPGLGRGWSVWPFTSGDGPGLLAISPNELQPEMARHHVLAAGGASVPVLLVFRGQEPQPVAAALEAAHARARWPQ